MESSVHASVMRKFMRIRIPLLCVCMVTVILLGVFQSSLKTDREKIQRRIDGVNNLRMKPIVGELTREDSRKLHRVDRVQNHKPDYENGIDDIQFDIMESAVDDYASPADKGESVDRLDQAAPRLVVKRASDRDNAEATTVSSNKIERDFRKNKNPDYVENQIHDSKSNNFDSIGNGRRNQDNITYDVGEYITAQRDNNTKDKKLLLEQLLKLLLKLKKEGLNIDNMAAKLVVHDQNPSVPFDRLVYPQNVNITKLVTLGNNRAVLPRNYINKDGGLPSNPINMWKYRPIINPSTKCGGRKTSIFLLFIVKSGTDNFQKRKTLRKTWADGKRFSSMRTVFSMGIPQTSDTMNKLKQESHKYKDILVMDYMDTYDNLTLKTISGINWAVTYCKMAQFVVSVDDDMYVATDFLINHLKSLSKPEVERLYLGHVYEDSRPVRHTRKGDYESKWVISKEEYPFSTYPPYVFGGCVIMSMRTVVEMSLVIPYTKIIKMEDAYLGIVASRLGIVPTNTDLVDKYITYSNSEKFKSLIASHFYKTSNMVIKAWECHLSMLEKNVEKSVLCTDIKTELEKLKRTVDKILQWIDVSEIDIH